MSVSGSWRDAAARGERAGGVAAQQDCGLRLGRRGPPVPGLEAKPRERKRAGNITVIWK